MQLTTMLFFSKITEQGIVALLGAIGLLMVSLSQAWGAFILAKHKAAVKVDNEELTEQRTANKVCRDTIQALREENKQLNIRIDQKNKTIANKDDHISLLEEQLKACRQENILLINNSNNLKDDSK